MKESDVEVLEYIKQLKISSFIKKNRNMSKTELREEIEKIIEQYDVKKIKDN